MGKMYNGGILTTAGFKFQSNKPLDDRAAVERLADLQSITAHAYEGLIVYVKNEGRYYYYANAAWQPLAAVLWEDYLEEE